MASSEPRVIDGSSMEGGGQILRTSVSYSALLNIPVNIQKIRGGRKKPGLRNQHLMGIELVRDLYQGELTGGSVKSMEITFQPGERNTSKTEWEVISPTASSIALLFQTAFPCMLFSPRPLSLTMGGATNGAFSPQVDYTMNVFKPMVERLFDVNFDLIINTRGFPPKGGGNVTARVEPVNQLNAFELTDFGEVQTINIKCIVTGRIPAHVGERMANAAKNDILVVYPDVEINIDVDYQPRASPGCGIVIAAHTTTGCIIGGSCLGEKRKRAEVVGGIAARDLLNCLKLRVCADEHLADQLIQLMALAKGTSKLLTCPLSLHTKSIIHFSQELCGANITVEDVNGNGKQVLITCEGIGLEI